MPKILGSEAECTSFNASVYMGALLKLARAFFSGTATEPFFSFVCIANNPTLTTVNKMVIIERKGLSIAKPWRQKKRTLLMEMYKRFRYL